MTEVETYLADRTSEMQQHLSLLYILDRRSQEKPKDDDEDRIKFRHVLILKSSILIHLYNIVEATMIRILDDLAIRVSGHHPKDYTDAFFNQWIKISAGTHDGLAPDNLLVRMSSAGKDLVQNEYWRALEIKKGAGSWDDKLIAKTGKSLGISLDIDDNISRPARERFVDDDSRMTYLRKKRNQLAHGLTTFEEGARDRTNQELEELAEAILNYMQAVVACFESFADAEHFLRQDSAA